MNDEKKEDEQKIKKNEIIFPNNIEQYSNLKIIEIVKKINNDLEKNLNGDLNIPNFQENNENSDFEKYNFPNDVLLFLRNIEKISKIKNLYSISHEEYEKLLSNILKILQNNYKNYNLVSSLLSFLGKEISHKKQIKTLIFDFNLFYKIYYIYRNNPSYNFLSNKYIYKFYYNFLKSSPENENKIDYNLIKKDILFALYHFNDEHYKRGLDLIKFFAPLNKLKEDKNLQEILFNLMKNKKSSFIGLCEIFSKILAKNGKLNLDNFEDFLEIYFTRLNEMIFYNNKDIISYPNELKSNESDKKKKYFFKNKSNHVENTLINLLFNENYVEYFNLIEKHLKIILQNIETKSNINSSNFFNIEAKEKKEINELQSNTIKFLINIFDGMNKLFSKKKYYSDLEKNVYEPIENSNENKFLFDRLKIVLFYFKIIIKKLFIFDIKHNHYILESYFKLMSLLNQNEEICNYFQEFINNLFIFQPNLNDNLNKIQEKKNDENNELFLLKFLSKFDSILIYFITKQYFISKNIKELFIKIINYLPDKITDKNKNISLYVIKIFYKIFLICQNDEKYSDIKEIINEASFNVTKNILNILDLIKTSKLFFIYIHLQLTFINDEYKEKISDLFYNFLISKELKKDLIKYFLQQKNRILTRKNIIKLFKKIDRNLDEDNKGKKFKDNKNIYIIDEELNEINNYHCPFNNDYIKNVDILISDDYTIDFWKEIFINLNFNLILFEENDNKIIEENKKIIYNLIYSLLNKKENKYYNIVYCLISGIINSLINPEIIDDKIIYPSKEKINFVIELYENVILPFKQSVQKIINKNEYLFKNEKIFEIYVGLLKYFFLNNFENIFLYINYKQDSENFKEIFNEFNNFYNDSYINYFKILNEILKDAYDILNNNIKEEDENKKIFTSVLTINNLFFLFRQNFINSFNNYSNIINQINAKNVYVKKYLYIPEYKKMYISLKNIKDYYENLKIIKYYNINNEILFQELLITCCNYNNNIDNNSFIKSFVFHLNLKNFEFNLKINEIILLYLTKLKSLNVEDNLNTNQIIMNNIVNNTIYLTFVNIYINPYNLISSLLLINPLIIELSKKKFKNFKESILKIFKEFILLQTKYLNLFNTNYKIHNILNKFPHINELYNKEDENINEKNYKLKNLLNQIKKYLSSFIEDNIFDIRNLDNNDNYVLELIFFNISYIQYILLLNDKDLYNKYINILLKAFLSENYNDEIKKKILYILFKLFNSKFKYEKKYEKKVFSEDEYNKNYKEILKSLKNKKNIKYNKIPVDYIVYKNYNKNIEENNSNIKLNLETIIKILYKINDWTNDQILNNKNLDNNKKNEIKEIIKNNILQQKNNNNQNLNFLFNLSIYTENLFNIKISKIVFYLIAYKYLNYNEINYNSILKILKENYKNVENNLIAITTFLNIFIGLILYDLKYKIYDPNKNNFLDVFNFYTNNSNNNIDKEIFNSLNFIIKAANLNQIETIFGKNINNFPLQIKIKICNLIFHNFDYNCCLFNKENLSYENVENLIDEILNNSKNLIKYSNVIDNLIQFYLILKGDLKSDEKLFKFEINENLYNFIENKLINNKNSDDKNLLKIFNTFFYYNTNIIILNLNIFSKFITKISISKVVNENLNILNNFISSLNRIIFPINFINFIDNLDLNNKNITNKIVIINTILKIYKINQHYFKNNSNLDDKILFEKLCNIYFILNDKEKEIFKKIFIYYFNYLDDEKNKIIINENINNEKLFPILLCELLRFKIEIPIYAQNLLINIYKSTKNKTNINKIIIQIKNHYNNVYMFIKDFLNKECQDLFENLQIIEGYNS